MTGFPNSPRLVKGGLVLIDPGSAAVLRVIALQYNPETVTRTFQIKAIGEGGGDRSEAMRLTAPPVETFKIDAEIDATDALEHPDQNPDVVESGIQAQLAALETIVYPPAARLRANNALASSGTLEIAPVESPLTLFIWSRYRIVPVRITELSITEEAFDPKLNPIRAKVGLGMRVLNVNDLGFAHKGGSLYLTYQDQKERFAAAARSAVTSTLGIGGIP
jgi:hypothetical protein